jgi:DNA mismatch repair protein MutS2
VQRFGQFGRIVRVDHRKNAAVVSVGLGQWEVPLEEITPEAPAQPGKSSP